MTDRNGRMKLFSVLQLMQDCSEMWKEAEPGFLRFLQEQGAAQLLAFRQLEVLRVPALGEQLTCTTTVFDCRGANGFRNTIVTDSAGRPCYESWSQGAFVHMQTGRLMRLPQAVVAGMHMSPRYEMTYRPRKIALPDSPGRQLLPFAVQRNDIDYNQHVNNAHYIRMALEYLPVEFEVGSLRVEFKYPARYGELLQPAVYAGDETYIVTLSAADKVSCVVEFNRSLGQAPCSSHSLV